MVAHEANYQRLAHRALNPVGVKTETSVRGSLQSAVDLVPVAGKVILSIEGGKHKDFEAAEAYLASQNLGWQIVHNTEVTSYYETMMRGLEQCTSPLVAIIPAWIEISDPLWVQRMTWPMQKDQSTLLCTTWAEQGPAKDLAPHVATPRKWPGGEIILARRAELAAIIRTVDPADLYGNLALAVAASGWRLWAHPGIRFKVLEHDLHDARKTDRRKAGQASASSDS